ncbi:hypothetical protein GUJ93_ZPchr0010g8007 [Zizania palustris]|uniref:Reverse transcriptase Ty1/copia-type domain-containing protein n=1 Tax=Zizania palustris TaxID=103762 RepID=A0A8J5WGI2_ZIZPA|nr:hypothetical protein GUJ93_ZPchr0010g8007 [Zizania palustris]
MTGHRRWFSSLIPPSSKEYFTFGNSGQGKFSEQMHTEFEMSIMGELKYFLGLQIKQTMYVTFIHQGKYTRDMLKKFDFGGELKPQMTPMGTSGGLDKDESDVKVNEREF